MSYTLLRESFLVARKPHRCIWCGEWIETGEKYRRERSVYDGSMQDHKWHLDCDKGFKVELDAGMDQKFIPYSNERPAPAAGVPDTKTTDGGATK